MFIIHQSNRLERLFEQLLGLFETPLADVMAAETVIVQSQGMARWLSLQLAEKQGICANLDCPFPASYIWRIFSGLEAAVPDDRLPAYEPDVLLWSIMEIIGSRLEEPAFRGVKGYIQRQSPDLRRYQLSGKLAALFGQYMVQRPDWIRDWERGGGAPLAQDQENWQAMIWRALLDRHGKTHRVALFDAMRALSREELQKKISLPERLSIFGIPAMPQSQLEVFAHLGQWLDVHLFLLTPSQHYWADLVSKKDVVRAGLHHESLDPVRDLHFEEGCQLLMGLGRLGRDFQSLLLSLDEYAEEAAFEEPGDHTLLALLQSDILAGVKSEPLTGDSGSYFQDASLQIHAAHSPMREVEVLHDQLLALLQGNAELEARDILVMVPDISRYAPIIDAVFSQRTGSAAIPFSIADRGGAGVITKIFFDLFSLAGSRFAVDQVLALLDQEPVRSHFQLSADDLLAVKAHLARTSVHWGLDPAHRQQLGVPVDITGTWRQGLDRMLLGFLLPAGDEQLFEGILPYDHLEGSDGELLGKLMHFHHSLTLLHGWCSGRHTLAEWRTTCFTVLETFVGSSEVHHRQLQRIRNALDAMARQAETAQTQEKLPLEVVASALEKRLATSFDQDFLCGRVTFCQMVPMRSIPFAVVCLLGMNDNAFPRYERPAGFDLMAGTRRPGDRNRRDDDRYLFLETLLSARKTLYISYVGLNDRDHREAPPSVVVSELLDHIAQKLSWSSEQGAAFITRHPLQPFSRSYFAADGALTTYSQLSRQVSAELGSNRRFTGLFGLEEAAPAPVTEEVDLDSLLRFFEHPVRYLLRQRFDLFLDDFFDQPEARECFTLDRLALYKLADAFTEQELAEQQRDNQQLIAQIRGELPAGRAGDYYYEQVRELTSGFAEEIRQVRGAVQAEALEFSLSAGPLHLTGSLDDLWSQGQCFHRPSQVKKINYRDLVTAWLRHLVFNCLEGDVPRRTFYVFRDGVVGFEPYPEARQELESLLELFVAGQSRPLPLFRQASYAYAQTLWGGSKGEGLREKALMEAQKIWEQGGYFQGAPEKADPYLAAAFGESDPVAGPGQHDFEAVAATVLQKPLQLLRHF